MHWWSKRKTHDPLLWPWVKTGGICAVIFSWVLGFFISFFTLQGKHFVHISFHLREDLWIPRAGKPTHELQLLALFHSDWRSVHEAKYDLGPSLKLPLTHIKLYLSLGSWCFSKPKKAEFWLGSKLGTGWLLMQQHQSALAVAAAATHQLCWYRKPEYSPRNLSFNFSCRIASILKVHSHRNQKPFFLQLYVGFWLWGRVWF